MAPLTHLDTHVLVWLHLPRPDLLSPSAIQAIEDDRLAVSPLVSLELTYLHEIGRLTEGGPAIVASVAEQLGVELDRTPLVAVVAAAQGSTWTRDPFDRLISGQARAAGARLLTKDQSILENEATAFW